MMRRLMGLLACAFAYGFAISCSSDSETTASSSAGAGDGAAASSGASGIGGASASGGATGRGGASGNGGASGSAAVGGSAGNDSGSAGAVDGGGAAGSDAGTDGGTFIGSCSSTLPHVCIRFPAQRTSFTLAEAAAGLTFRYEVVIDEDVAGVVTLPQDAGQCGSPSPGGLYVLEQVMGGGQSYCICDTGLCFPPPETPVTLVAGVYPATFAWDGVNWGGPSDTGNPKGAPFPAGTYNVTVSAVGQREVDAGLVGFVVTGTLGIELTP